MSQKLLNTFKKLQNKLQLKYAPLCIWISCIVWLFIPDRVIPQARATPAIKAAGLRRLVYVPVELPGLPLSLPLTLIPQCLEITFYWSVLRWPAGVFTARKQLCWCQDLRATAPFLHGTRVERYRSKNYFHKWHTHHAGEQINKMTLQIICCCTGGLWWCNRWTIFQSHAARTNQAPLLYCITFIKLYLIKKKKGQQAFCTLLNII